jgi:Flp pilus assembly protein TadB
VKYGYGSEFTPGLVLLGAVLVLPFVPGFALIVLVVVAIAAVAALVALAGAILATPYLLARTVRRRLAERHEETEGSMEIATGIAQAAAATNPLGTPRRIRPDLG